MIHCEIQSELERQINVKTKELKSIVPARDFEPQEFIEDGEMDMTILLKTYVVDNTKVGEEIESTMKNTKVYLNRQFTNMQKLFQAKQERILRERETAKILRNQDPEKVQNKGIFGRFLSTIAKSTQKPIEKAKEEIKIIPGENNEDYLLSTNTQPSVTEATLIDITENTETETEKEVQMKIEDDEETKISVTETVIEQNEDSDGFKLSDSRIRSDSLMSTSTNRIYSYKDLNDFANIEELHKFLYK